MFKLTKEQEREYALGERIEQIENSLIKRCFYNIFKETVESDEIQADRTNGYGKHYASWMPVADKKVAKRFVKETNKYLKAEKLDKCFNANYGNLNSDWENASCIIIESNPDIFTNFDLENCLTLYKLKYND